MTEKAYNDAITIIAMHYGMKAMEYSDAGKWYVHGATESPHVEVTVWDWAEYAGMGESR